MNPKVDAFLDRAKTWHPEMTELRQTLLACPVTEELKWGKPCYAFEGSNIAIIQPFKDYVALMFFKGALLKDPQNHLVQPTENMQAARQLRFTTLQEVTKAKDTIQGFVQEAIKAEEAGLEVQFKETKDFDIPQELQSKLDQDPEFKTAFESLTPGRQRGYILHFSQPKQSTTRTSRIEKLIPKILEGKGFRD